MQEGNIIFRAKIGSYISRNITFAEVAFHRHRWFNCLVGHGASLNLEPNFVITRLPF